ncbi:MAG: bifunctional riboflavin kinase/FAD synthetase [Planctomycetota bacterium]|nr:bifunctional riboflavin kinase/FAD synthetase [Planctomycetota bacterium]
MIIASIGNFDGVHRGHQAIVAAARAAAGAGGRVVAVTFDPLPVAVLRPDAAPARLTSAARREALLLECGCDAVHVLDPRSGILTESPEGFIEHLRAEVPFDAIAEGADFRFGRGRSGDVTTLAAIGARVGFKTIEVPEVDEALSDGSMIAARSTAVRWMLSMGRVADAARLLGRAHALEGVVERGDQRGRLLGFPTANIMTTSMALPADGVYAGRAIVDGRHYQAAISVGTKPTFGSNARVCEAHVLGLDAALDSYGWPIEVRFERWLRSQWRFPGPDALVAQLREDVARTAALA